MNAPGDEELAARRQAHWRASLRVTAWLLAGWVVVTFVVAWFARDLRMVVLGWPVGFWFCAQGALLVYVGITWLYARTMRRLDARYGIDPESAWRAGTSATPDRTL